MYTRNTRRQGLDPSEDAAYTASSIQRFIFVESQVNFYFIGQNKYVRPTRQTKSKGGRHRIHNTGKVQTYRGKEHGETARKEGRDEGSKWSMTNHQRGDRTDKCKGRLVRSGHISKKGVDRSW